ncbi:Bifunctional nitric oxide dioxygenase/dihydropteridine reductase 2 [Pseudomonas syringae pv. primulae]|uniref:nitric oxide dioxygenase n=2 Tax=Pseudomonas syringae group genomosp. 3 TaxID=251701 RepID=A0A3M4SK09_9PSED|nr:Bifunctional nitric oxide dioxygenase/dihydropteridine reductase 2 [Pseudomonas syringae pv. primulae]
MEPTMLTSTQRDIIKATVPLLETGGEALITYFYQLMLDTHPEVRPLFNQANQANGSQPRALANGVLMYARNIDRLENLGGLASQIINKHVALQILPEHYPIVGACLLQAIRDVLGAETATNEVIEAWAAAYQQLADILIAGEQNAYDAIAAAPGGWRGARPFTVQRKVAESAEITSFYLAPSDHRPVIRHKAGQYIGLRLMIDGQEVRRNYSLSEQADGVLYRISVKREQGGRASTYLHDHVEEGSTLDVFPPSGDFTLNEHTKPLVLISGGVGITPTLAMAEQALESGERSVTFIHYARSRQAHAFSGLLRDWQQRYPLFKAHVVYAERADHEVYTPDAIGFPSLTHLEQWLPADRDIDAYFLGPTPFMAFMKRALKEVGVPENQARYEFFGPAQALA